MKNFEGITDHLVNQLKISAKLTALAVSLWLWRLDVKCL